MDANITIYRGTHQIGGCVTEIQVGDSRIIIDFGANLPDSKAKISDEEIVDTVFPKDSSKAKCEGVLFTHYHGDHYGLYKNVPSDIPMYIGMTAKKVLEIIAKRVDYTHKDETDYEEGLPRIKGMNTYNIGKWKKFADSLEVMPLVVDHSALDAYMFVIKAAGKKILFTGDFRDHGITGENEAFDKMLKEYVGEVDILITEGTMLSREEKEKNNLIKTEKELGEKAKEIFAENHENVVLVSSTNLDSIMSFYHAVPNDKAFVCDAYQAEVILTAIADKGKYYNKYKLDKIGNVTRNFYIVDYNGKPGKEQHCFKADWDILKEKGFVMLARANHNPKMKIGKFESLFDKMDNPKIIYSMWEGYREGEHADEAVVNFLKGHEGNIESLHTSGHAYVETIARLIEMTNPKMIIPMHTECADDFAKIEAFAQYSDRVRVLTDGEKFSIAK